MQPATFSELNQSVEANHAAFALYRYSSLDLRHQLLYAIAAEIDALGDALLEVAASETNLPLTRLRSERARTLFQLRHYADQLLAGHPLDARIDTADPNRAPPKPDLRKMNVPIGPVAVFGASNFPLAYSTAGGDTACALAAGCSVVLKAHPAHPQTSERVAKAIWTALDACQLPSTLFAHVQGGIELGEALVKHPLIKAVGFTGSFDGGRQLFRWGAERPEPIPVFAEMGSLNPVCFLPKGLAQDITGWATRFAQSVTQNAGQFCTKPGLLILLDDAQSQLFLEKLRTAFDTLEPIPMLHTGIEARYHQSVSITQQQSGIHEITSSRRMPNGAAVPILQTISANDFLQNKTLQQEVFGPYTLAILCRDLLQLLEVANSLHGQLTAGLIATPDELLQHAELIQTLQHRCGRLIFNGVPTGVDVGWAMQHGGPWPASSDSRFSAVGADGIRRFLRPVAYQDCPPELLPDALQDENPLGIWRMVNNEWKR
jgi:NADP-dependent aldehyde dehydrogenase